MAKLKGVVQEIVARRYNAPSGLEESCADDYVIEGSKYFFSPEMFECPYCGNRKIVKFESIFEWQGLRAVGKEQIESLSDTLYNTFCNDEKYCADIGCDSCEIYAAIKKMDSILEEQEENYE